MYARPCYRVFVLVVVLLCSTSACRRHDPPPLLARNLGTPDRPLLPTAPRKYDASILRGKAVPQRAAELVEEEEPETTEVGEDEISAEDRELIEEVVDLAIEALIEERFDDAIELLHPDQQETAETLLEQIVKLAEAGAALGAALKEKMPAGTPMDLTGMMPGLGGMAGQVDPKELAKTMKIADLQMVGEDQAAGSVAMMGQTVPLTFRLIDDEWYFELPEILDDQEVVDALVEAGGVIDEKVRDLAARIEDGSVDPEALMPELMKMVQELAPVLAKLGPEFEGLAAAPEPPTDTTAATAATDTGDADREPSVEAEVSATADLPEDIRQAIGDLLAEYDQAEAEQRRADTVALHVPEQRESARIMVDQADLLIEAMHAFADSVDKGMPGAGASIERQLAQGARTPKTIIESELVSPDKVTATIQEGGDRDPLEFRRVDGEWYVWDPELAEAGIVARMAEALKSTTGKIETLTEKVDDDSLAANAAMGSFMQIMRDFSAEMRRLSAEATGEEVEPRQPPRRGRRRGDGIS